MPPFAALGLGLNGAGDLTKFIYGLTQIFGKDKKYQNMVDNLPKYQVDPNITYNRNLAANWASQGFGNQYLNNATDMSERVLGSQIGTALATGQGLDAVGRAGQQSTDAFKQLLMEDAMQKAKNREDLYTAGKDLRDENLRAWDYNTNIPAQLKLSHFNDRQNSGWDNIIGATKGLGSTSLGFADLLKNGLGTPTGTGAGGDLGSGDWSKYMSGNYGGNLSGFNFSPNYNFGDPNFVSQLMQAYKLFNH